MGSGGTGADVRIPAAAQPRVRRSHFVIPCPGFYLCSSSHNYALNLVA